MENGVPLLWVQLVLEGEGMEVTMSSSESRPQRGKQAVTFRYHHSSLGSLSWVWDTVWLTLPGVSCAGEFSPPPCPPRGFNCAPITVPGCQLWS